MPYLENWKENQYEPQFIVLKLVPALHILVKFIENSKNLLIINLLKFGKNYHIFGSNNQLFYNNHLKTFTGNDKFSFGC